MQVWGEQNVKTGPWGQVLGTPRELCLLHLLSECAITAPDHVWQQVMAHVAASSLPMWKTQIERWAPDSGLIQSGAIGIWGKGRTPPICLYLSNKVKMGTILHTRTHKHVTFVVHEEQRLDSA